MSSYPKARNYKRALNRNSAESGIKLQGNIEKFFIDCIGKTDAEIKDLYDWYNNKWREYAEMKNSVTKSFKVFDDAFEDTMQNLYKTIRNVDPNDVTFEMPTAIHVCNLYRKKTRAERFFMWLENKFKRRPKDAVLPPLEADQPEVTTMQVVK